MSRKKFIESYLDFKYDYEQASLEKNGVAHMNDTKIVPLYELYLKNIKKKPKKGGRR